MKKMVLVLAMATMSAFAGVPVKWTVETSRADTQEVPCYHGETLDMEVTFKNYGQDLFIPTNIDAQIFWQTNGMSAFYWRTNNVTVVSNKMYTAFLPEMDPGTVSCKGFVGVPGQIYRASFVLRFKDSPGLEPKILEWPYRELDFTKVEVKNAPYYEKSETYSKEQVDERINWATITNLYDTSKRKVIDGEGKVYEKMQMIAWTNDTSGGHGEVPEGLSFLPTTETFGRDVAWKAVKDGNTYKLYEDYESENSALFELHKNGMRPFPRSYVTAQRDVDVLDFGTFKLYRFGSGEILIHKDNLALCSSVSNVDAKVETRTTRSYMTSTIGTGNASRAGLLGIYSSLNGETLWPFSKSYWDMIIYPDVQDWVSDNYVPTSRKVNGKPLTSDITIESMPDNGLVLTNDAVKTKSGTAITASQVGATDEATVNAIIASSNLCTVEAAQAMTNDPKIVRGELFDESSYIWNITVHSSLWSSFAYWGGIFDKPTTLSGYGITDAYTKEEINGTSVTNGGAKAYADATFVAKTGAVVRTNFKLREYENDRDIIRKDTSVDGGWHFLGVSDSCESVGSGNDIYIKLDNREIVFDTSGFDPSNESRLSPDRSPVATSNMVERVIASKPSPSPLTGKTYDFANGSNFTKRVYIALTNVIQTLGGTVANPPAFN